MESGREVHGGFLLGNKTEQIGQNFEINKVELHECSLYCTLYF